MFTNMLHPRAEHTWLRKVYAMELILERIVYEQQQGNKPNIIVCMLYICILTVFSSQAFPVSNKVGNFNISQIPLHVTL